jgi:integrase
MPSFTYAYSLDEARRILAILPEPARTMVAVAAFTGVRKSELVALKWENYDGNKIFVTEKFTHGKVGTPKCNSQGVIPVAETLRQYLETHRVAIGSPEDGYVFRSATGTPISIDRLTISVVRPTLKAANIPWYGWHAFRRGFATSLFHLHVADRIIQQLLRHSDIATTMNVYVKAVGEDGRDAIAMLDKTFQRKVA